MLYPKNRKPFDLDLFQSPTSEYRGVPFWAWNCRVTPDKIRRQTECFRQMGMGGAMLHPRTGMDTEYLSSEYFDLVRKAEEELRARDMYCWLYDEERFPSGVAGGIVTRDVRFRARTLLLTKQPQQGFCADLNEFDRRVSAGEKPRGYFLCAYDIELKDGYLSSYRQDPGGAYRAYVELWPESPWFNGESYVDVFSPQAIDRFLEVTHAAYARALEGHVGKTVPAIFTDEPHMKGKYCMPTPDAERATLVFTEELNASFHEQWGVFITDILPELLWEQKDLPSAWRYRYHEHVTERFSANYGDRIGSWCADHHIAYTGHFMSERTLYSQTLALGETMRQYRSQQLPGIDILAGQLEITTAKQAESVRRQLGREGLVCEMYGVLEWDVRFLQHKLQGDWLAALGVTTRVHHLAFMSMAGEAKRDWPASIAWQSPWWTQYNELESYFARVNTLLTRGTPISRVAVVHPIESFWLRFGPSSQTLEAREQMDEQFESLAQWLLYVLIDFDYISESLLPAQCEEGGAPLCVGYCKYDTVILPPLLTIRSSTLKRLTAFAQNGGRLLSLSGAPRLVDGLPSNEAEGLWRLTQRVGMARSDLLNALEGERDIEVRYKASGKRSDNLFYQLRQDQNERTLFLCHVREVPGGQMESYAVRLRGNWSLTCMDAQSGKSAPLGALQRDGWTEFTWDCYAQDSLLLRMTPGACAAPAVIKKRLTPLFSFTEAESFTLDEPNALLIDRFEYALNDEPLEKPCEILRLDNLLRARVGLPARNGDQVQPWLLKPEAPRGTIHLRARFQSEIDYNGALLAMEQPENARAFLNGEAISTQPTGFYVDEDIATLRLPPIRKGENALELFIPLTRRANPEAVYILGSFGVCATGTGASIVPPPKTLALYDVTRQGLPFYTGNLRYRFIFDLTRDVPSARVRLPHLTAPCARAFIDQKDAGLIACSPFEAALGALKKGAHTLEILAFGSRYNGFGTLHCADPNYKWYGPMAYRTEGWQWTDNRILRAGHLTQPIWIIEETINT